MNKSITAASLLVLVLLATSVVPRACHVKLEIFNIIGQRVTTLVDRDVSAGYHRVTWDGTKLASGIYLYRLQTSEFVESKKMLLVK